MKKKISSHVHLLFIVFFVIGCQNKKTEKKIAPNNNSIIVAENSTILTQEGAELLLDSLKASYKPLKITEKEFENFKKKSDYKKVINATNENLGDTYFKYIDKENRRFYALPEEANETEYGSNSFVFGDLNEDGKRDCIVTALRSDMYNEIHFFYVFINQGSSFELMHIANEDDLTGCKNGGWLSLFRYQIIENGFFKGIAFCHYNDAHCCPSLIFKSQAIFVAGTLQFHSSEFVMDDPYMIQYRPTPVLDSVVVKRNFN